MTLQLTLGLNIRDEAIFSNFYEGGNSNLISCLKQFVAVQAEQFIYLYGQPGVGRSHLLQACCHAVSDQNQSAVYLTLRDNRDLAPELLESLEHLDLVCIDDIDAVLRQSDWEEALFHFYNRVKEHNTRLIVTANDLPVGLSCQLPDLQSRLSQGLVFHVKGLNDEQTLLALQLRAHHRGLQLPREVGEFLLRRYPRNMNALFEVLVKLDQASMVAKRRLTIPFVKNVLNI